MLLDLATALTPWLDARKERVEAGGGEEGREGQGESLQIIFFDGEEAFKDWTHTDSIYGARHLAHKWGATTDHSPQPVRATPRSPLRRISHLVLLDLLGAPNPLLRNFFVPTGWLFDEFLHAEERLGLAGHLWQGLDGDAYTAKKGETGALERSFFVPRGSGVSAYAGQIEDDHLPFLREGVPIVHLISVPFPRVWHTIKVRVARFGLSVSLSPSSRTVRLTLGPPRSLAGRRRRARPPDGQSVGPHHPPRRRRVPRTRPVGAHTQPQLADRGQAGSERPGAFALASLSPSRSPLILQELVR